MVTDWLRWLRGSPKLDKTGQAKPSAAPFKYDKAKEGWTKLEDVEFRISSVGSLQPLPFLRGSERYVSGKVMKRRAEEEKANFGQLDAEWLLDHQSEIPSELRVYHLVFPGTVWQDSSGRRGVAHLYWGRDHWCLGWFWLADDWYSYFCLLSPGKS